MYGSDSESEANILPAQCSPPAPETATMLHAAPGWTSPWAWGRTAVTHPEKRSGFSAAWDGGQKWSAFTADCVPRRTNLGPGGCGNGAAMWVNAVLGYKGRRESQGALHTYRRQLEISLSIEGSQRGTFKKLLAQNPTFAPSGKRILLPIVWTGSMAKE